jgi:hypothetical protein
MQASAADYELNYFNTAKRQLVTWTVVGLTTAKFKPPVFRDIQTSENNTLLRFGGCDYRRSTDWILDLLTQLGTTSNYTVIADLHNSKITSTR